MIRSARDYTQRTTFDSIVAGAILFLIGATFPISLLFLRSVHTGQLSPEWIAVLVGSITFIAVGAQIAIAVEQLNLARQELEVVKTDLANNAKRPDLWLTSYGCNLSIQPGEEFGLLLKLRNLGTRAATSWRITLVMPPGLSEKTFADIRRKWTPLIFPPSYRRVSTDFEQTAMLYSRMEGVIYPGEELQLANLVCSYDSNRGALVDGRIWWRLDYELGATPEYPHSFLELKPRYRPHEREYAKEYFAEPENFADGSEPANMSVIMTGFEFEI